MPELLDLSAELLQAIFEYVEPSDLGSLVRSCWTLNRFIDGNRLLWKQVYLARYVSSTFSDDELLGKY
jgi:hypothetical protein